MSETVRLLKFVDEGKVPPGHYRPIVLDKQHNAFLSCGQCGEGAYLDQDHKIGPDGTITPSLYCPADCGWHVMGVLDGWPDLVWTT